MFIRFGDGEFKIMSSAKPWGSSRSVSYTHLDVYKRQIVLGLGFGVLLQSKGYGAGWALVMSGLIYAGSMQYVAIDLLAGGASLISAAIITLIDVYKRQRQSSSRP